MTDSEQSRSPGASDSIQFLTYRGRIGRLLYFLGLFGEVALLFLGLASLAAANNPTGGGGGIGLLLFMIPVVVWIHSLLVVNRMRDAGQSTGASLLFAIGPFVWIPFPVAIWLIAGDEKLELIAADLWQIVVITMIGLWLVPGLVPPKTGVPKTA